MSSLRLMISVRSSGTFANRSVNLPPVVTAIRPNQFEPREAPAYLVEHQPGAVAILDRCRVDNDPQRQSFGIDESRNSGATKQPFWLRLLASVEGECARLLLHAQLWIAGIRIK